MLGACRRLLKPGGKTGYLTIHVAPGLSRRQHRRAVRWGPRAVASRADQRALLERAGFGAVDEVDVTAEYLETARAWLRESWRFEHELRKVLGNDEFDRLQRERPVTISAIEDGLLRRSLLVGTNPPHSRPYTGVRYGRDRPRAR